MDDADRAQEMAEKFPIAEVKAYKIPKGHPGECDICGEWSGRLVGGVCAPCRDQYNLK